MSSAPVVVGVGAPRDHRAVRWAAGEARDLGVGLRLVHATIGRGGTSTGEALLAEAVDVAREVAPELAVSAAVVEGGPVPVLRDEAVGASLVVVGSDGLGYVLDLLLGGVARGLAGHLEIPVVVVPSGYTPSGAGAVIIGDDGTLGSAAARHYAARRAERRGAHLATVTVTGERADRVLVDRSQAAEVVVLGVGRAQPMHPSRRTRPTVVVGSACPVVIVPPHEWPAEVPPPVPPRILDDAGPSASRRGTSAPTAAPS